LAGITATDLAGTTAGFTGVAFLAGTGTGFLGTAGTMGVWANMSELARSKPGSMVLARADGFRKGVFVRIFIFCLLFNVLFPGQMYLKAK